MLDARAKRLARVGVEPGRASVSRGHSRDGNDTRLRREREGARSTERLREQCEHGGSALECDALKAANPKRCEAEVVFQPSESALDSELCVRSCHWGRC